MTIPDNTIMEPGKAFTKTWRVKNSGAAAWKKGTKLVFMKGNQMGAPKSVPVTEIKPNATIDISVDMVAPDKPGNYRTTWRLQAPDGTYFGDELYAAIAVASHDEIPQGQEGIKITTTVGGRRSHGLCHAVLPFRQARYAPATACRCPRLAVVTATIPAVVSATRTPPITGIRTEAHRRGGSSVKGSIMQHESIEATLRPVAGIVDTAAILAAWQRLSPVYDVEQWVLPLPPWARRPYTEIGQQAWERLRDNLMAHTAGEAMCIYMHIPFCASKCHFCDSYSFKLGGDRQRHVEEYVSLLEQEMALWSQTGTLAQRPVSTVHFGGGTPIYVGGEAFARVVKGCAARFHTTDATEWAIESTVHDLSTAMVQQLHDLSFRRLHIGVQSLEEPVRTAIGRRSPARAVLEKIEEVRALGWIVSVDLICGLPCQTLSGFLDGVRTLVDHGIDGFSLYELLIYPQNRRWAEDQGLTKRAHLPNYLMFQTGAQLLERRGFRKNLFNHWANPRDDNRYFTFPTRGEDLLALGTIADGVFGDYHYRHPRYSEYRQNVSGSFPGLEGGLLRNRVENLLRPFISAILFGYLSNSASEALHNLMGNEAVRLVEMWQRCGLLVADAGSPGLSLTPSGSWFAGNMLLQLEDAFSRRFAGGER